jgi:hypothetical protein
MLRWRCWTTEWGRGLSKASQVLYRSTEGVVGREGPAASYRE